MITRQRITELHKNLKAFRDEVFTEQGQAEDEETHDVLGEVISAIDELTDQLEIIS